VSITEFLQGLKDTLKYNDTSVTSYKRIAGSAPFYNEPNDMNSPLTTRFLFGHIQKLVTPQLRHPERVFLCEGSPCSG
jgi:indolepyruvate decarboxylase